MNRAQRRAAGIVSDAPAYPVLELTAAQLDLHLPHVLDGQLITTSGSNNGRDGIYRVKVVSETLQ